MKTRLPVPVGRARSGTAESWRARVCFATLWGACVLGAAPAYAWVGTQEESSSQGGSTSTLSLQLRGLSRSLPQDPNPVQLQLPAALTEEELRGGYGFALALSIFSGLLITATLVLLFGLLAYQRWFAAEPSPSRHASPPSRRSSPSHR